MIGLSRGTWCSFLDREAEWHHAIRRFFVVLCLLLAAWPAPASAARLADFLPDLEAASIFPGADRLGTPQGEPPLVPAYAGNRLLGYVWLNTDVTDATGYSGKPIHILVAADTQGVIRGIRLVDHKEPIVLIGIPEQRILAALNHLIGMETGPIARAETRPPQTDIVSGATVTVLVMADSVVRSAIRLHRAGRFGAASAGGAAAPAQAPAALPPATLIPGPGEVRDWESLLGDGSVRRLHLSVGDVNEAFTRHDNPAAAENPEPGASDETFIDLYAALVTTPTIGRSLLGDAGHEQLLRRLRPGQHAILVAGEGIYSFKGSGYVRGGIFDRIELLQDGRSFRFRDRDHQRLGDIAAAGAPSLPEIALFILPENFSLDPTEPWELQLLVQRAIGVRDKAFLSFELGYRLPEQYISRPPAPAPAAAPSPPAAATAAPAAEEAPHDPLEEPLWQRIWRAKTLDIGITAVALMILTGIFFFQDQLVRRPVLFRWVRLGFLSWTLVWLGWYANAQLSVVNVLTFSSSLLTGFSWNYFLTSPLIFILWCGVAAALIFWGRGVFCGWLCPFGALQELLSAAAQKLKVPQIVMPWGLHERLWPVKYVIFLGLFGLSLYSVTLAEQAAEVEPFKTAIILKFVRDWPFTLYAVGLLAAGLFIERFFCRYLCPLGAALAIPGRLRTFEWLKRWPECGSPCQRCARECPVQSIHPEGNINPNECIYCMHCQELYRAEDRCPHNIQKRLKREKQIALSAVPLPSAGKGPKTSITRTEKGVAGKPATSSP